MRHEWVALVDLEFLAAGVAAGGAAASVIIIFVHRQVLKRSVPAPIYRWVTANVVEISLPDESKGAYCIRSVTTRYGAIQPLKNSYEAVWGRLPIEAAGPKAKVVNYPEGVDCLLIEPTVDWNVVTVFVESNSRPFASRRIALKLTKDAPWRRLLA